jgi:hypothetical protein
VTDLSWKKNQPIAFERSPSPLAREIQERFEQYQRTMRDYDQFVRGGGVGGGGTMRDEYASYEDLLSARATQGAAPGIRGTTHVQKEKGKGSAADIDANLERWLFHSLSLTHTHTLNVRFSMHTHKAHTIHTETHTH